MSHYKQDAAEPVDPFKPNATSSYISRIEQENEKLKADVTMLRGTLISLCEEFRTGAGGARNFSMSMRKEIITNALSATASSDAWMKEQKAKVLEDAATEADKSPYDFGGGELRAMAAYLRSPESDTDQATRLNG